MSSLKESVNKIKSRLKSEDVLVFEFESDYKKKFAAVYADGIADKELLGELVVKPLRGVKKEDDAERIKLLLASPEVKDGEKFSDAVNEISDGNAALFVDGEDKFFIIGLKKPPARAVAEPPTQIAVKGPREGFIEDVKTNLGLVRKRIKTDKLQIKTLKVGERSNTAVALVYIEGVCAAGLAERVEKEIKRHKIDVVCDSSYISDFISQKPKSVFKRCATSEKPDVFCAKVCEGRVGIIVDGSPIALTVPYMLVEDFQSVEDYYIAAPRATIIRFIRVAALLAGLFLPAFYVSAQLFKIQLIPLQLLLKISSSVSGLSLSPSLEMFLVLFVLEVLNEASIRMPKYVGLALSVVGALVLGDTAVKAGVISTPAIIIIAFSAICLYTVPDFVETSTTLRWLLLIIAGSVGPFGVTLAAAGVLSYLVTESSYGAPLLAPFAPLIKNDLRDAMIKANMNSLKRRPEVFSGKDKVRLRIKK